MSESKRDLARSRRAAYREAMRELAGDAVIGAYGYDRVPGTVARERSQERKPRRRAGGLCAPGSRAAVIAAECRAALAALAAATTRTTATTKETR